MGICFVEFLLQLSVLFACRQTFLAHRTTFAWQQWVLFFERLELHVVRKILFACFGFKLSEQIA